MKENLLRDINPEEKVGEKIGAGQKLQFISKPTKMQDLINQILKGLATTQ